MLPMRGVVASVVVLGIIAAAGGCRNQSGTYTNPFLTPDKVPPPQTRVLAPGTAQPYYQGDPMPGAPVIGGPAGAPPAAAPGTPVYQPVPGAAVGPATPLPGAAPLPGATPPSGWGGYGPTSSVAPPGSGTTRLAQREVTDAEFYSPGAFAGGATTASADVARDGFRPQGSTPRAAADADEGFRPPGIARDGATSMALTSSAIDAATAQVAANQFGATQNFDTMRGQLEYWPETGGWSLRYLPAGSPADSMGGRVMIDNPQVLANLQPGEMVSVRGQLFNKTTEEGAQAPTYRVSGLERQRQ
jgi:hypothetical protein